MTDQNLTEIIAVLDRSGSMAGSIGDVIGGFNTLVEKQRQVEGEAKFTLVIFDSEIEQLYEAVDVNDVVTLTGDIFFARGMTALNDALATAINNAGRRFADLPEEKRPSKVVVFVSTDGVENNSQEFPHRGNVLLKKLIETQKEQFSWEFIFTGADIDAVKESATVGVSAGSTLNYAKSQVGTQALYRGVSDKITQYRTGEVSCCSFTDEEKKKVEKHVTPGSVSLSTTDSK